MNKPHVLVVIDFPPLREFVVRLLMEQGYHTETAENGQEGWERFQRNPFDAVVSDNLMPLMTGPELAALVKQMDRYMPVILLTGTLEALPPGVDYLVKKPIDKNMLLGTLRMVLRRGAV